MEWVTDISNRKELRLWMYTDKPEKIVIRFEPLKMSDLPDWNPQWEEWHSYHIPLVIPLCDFERLLHRYFDKIYPTHDAFDGTLNESFDICFDNWIGEKDWRIIISAIRADFANFSESERGFYGDFLDWVGEALKHTRVIVAEGNL